MDLATLAGTWRGSWRTWVQPDELYSEGPIAASIDAIFDGKAAVVRYQATLDGDVDGYALLGATQDGPLVAWIDSWHTSGLVMTSHGAPAEGEFSVTTTYGAADERWTWTSEYLVDDARRLVIRHFNEGPGIPRYLGVEAVLERTGG